MKTTKLSFRNIGRTLGARELITEVSEVPFISNEMRWEYEYIHLLQYYEITVYTTVYIFDAMKM